MRIYRKTFAAGESANFDAVGNYFRCLASSAAFTCEVIAQDGSPEAVFDGFELGLQFRTEKSSVRVNVKNELRGVANAAQEIILAIHNGPIDDNRLVGTVNITGGILSKPLAADSYDLAGNFTATSAITTFGMGSLTTTQACELIIQNLGTVDVYVSPNPAMTTANSLLLSAAPAGATVGGSINVKSGVPWYARTASGTADLRIVRTRFS